MPTGASGRDGPWHPGWQQETNKTHQKYIFNKHPVFNRERQTTHGEGFSISPRNFAAEGEEGFGIERMFVILVIVTHSLDHLLSLCVQRLKSYRKERGSQETRWDRRKEGWIFMWNFPPKEHCDWLKQNSNRKCVRHLCSRHYAGHRGHGHSRTKPHDSVHMFFLALMLYYNYLFAHFSKETEFV